jgi:MoxR-like ATPase
MTSPSFLTLPDGHILPLEAQGGQDRSCHVFEQASIDAVNAALATHRPLLIRGAPGTGKSQLARAAAQALGRAFVMRSVDSRTETRDLLWEVDAVGRLARAQVLGALERGSIKEADERMSLKAFVEPGPLWWAFDWGSAKTQAKQLHKAPPWTPPGWDEEKGGVVVLCDEIDKADSSVPQGLLDALGHGRFDVPGFEAPIALDRARFPLIIFTTNEERTLPDAFVRRCWVLPLALPSEHDELVTWLMVRGRAHFNEEKGTPCDESILREAADQLATDRASMLARRLYAPGLAEYLDVLRALTTIAKTVDEQSELLERIKGFAFDKNDPERPR